LLLLLLLVVEVVLLLLLLLLLLCCYRRRCLASAQWTPPLFLARCTPAQPPYKEQSVCGVVQHICRYLPLRSWNQGGSLFFSQRGERRTCLHPKDTKKTKTDASTPPNQR
jgi:hypothetical protein